eukprot:2060236-Alexandrium_andersonii.AAC.1
MSASLVGSEMCIRDSICHPSARPGAGWRTNAHANGLRSRGAARGRRRPVSYTHLTLPTICSV